MNKEKVIEINKLLKNLDNDSKKVAQDSRNKLNKIAIDHFQRIYTICKELDYHYFDRYYGGNHVDFSWKDKNILYFLLSCKTCDESDQKSISIEDLSDFNYKAFEKVIRQKRIDHLRRVINSHKSEIIECEEKLNKLLQ